MREMGADSRVVLGIWERKWEFPARTNPSTLQSFKTSVMDTTPADSWQAGMAQVPINEAVEMQPGKATPHVPEPRKYLPGLNGLRTIAAGGILIGHVYQIAGLMGYQKAGALFHYFRFAGVNLFFVISGFLITYILYNEKVTTGAINLLHFYKKRLLRIWPLYFFLLFVVFALGAATPVYQNFGRLDFWSLGMFALFLVNLNGLIPMSVSVLPHYWSLSVEEQFYIFWPLSLRKRNPILVCLVVMAVLFLLRNGCAYLSSRYHTPFLAALNEVLVITSFGSMAIGGLAGIGFQRKWAWLSVFKKNGVWLLCWVAALVLLSGKVYVPYINSELQAVVFAGLILGAVSRKRSFLDWKAMDRTGRISYGLYMYHWPLIPVLLLLLHKSSFSFLITAWYSAPLVLLSFALTYAIAYLSYRYMELPIMRRSFIAKPATAHS